MVVLVILLVTGGSSRRKAPATVVLPRLVQRYANPAMGASGQLPAGWSAVRGPGLLQLRDPHGNALIVIGSSRDSASRLVATELAAIRKTYTQVRITRGVGSILGGLPAKSRVVYGRNVHKVPIRILVAGARGKRRNYILEAFTALHIPRNDLLEAQEVVFALRLAG